MCQCAVGERWELKERLGDGGFGDVYRAHCRRCGGEVALKVLRDVGNRDARHRFEREVRMLQGLRHNNIISIIDANPSAARPWYAMKLMKGGTLTQHCGRLDLPVAKLVMATLANTIAFLHEHGTIHRDIKPDNILINEAGQFALGDFGLGNDPRYTVAFTMHAMGTPAYAAPEVMNGVAATSASDVYSLGATFFHLLTGQVPAGVRDPRQVKSDIPANLAALVVSMLEPVAANRPTIQVVVGRLEGRLAAQPVPTPASPSPPSRGAGVDWEAVGAVAGVALLFVGLVALLSDG